MSIWEKTKQFIGLEEEMMESSPLKLQKNEFPQKKDKPKKIGRVITFPNQKSHSKMNVSQNDVMIIEPKIYEDSLIVSSWLKKSNTVVVNIKHLDAETGKRFIDFICGSAYAFEGHMHRLGGTIFLFTPAHMAIVPANEEDLSQSRQGSPQDLYEEEAAQYEAPQIRQNDFEYYDSEQEAQFKEVEYS